VTSQNVQVSDSFEDLTAIWKSFEGGVEREVSVYILDWIEKHKPAILADLGEFKTWIDTALPTAMDSLQKDMDSFSTEHFRQEIRDALKDLADLAGDIKTIQWVWDSAPVNWAIKKPFEAVWGDNSPTADATRAASGYIAGEENDEPYNNDPAATHELQRDHPLNYNASSPPWLQNQINHPATTPPSQPAPKPGDTHITNNITISGGTDAAKAAADAVRKSVTNAQKRHESHSRHRNAQQSVD
jgi:hypothetical protein